MRPLVFSFDDSPPFFGFTDDSHWNGFVNVWVTPGAHRGIVAYFEEHGDKESADAIAAVKIGADGLYCYGWGFATTEITAEHDDALIVEMIEADDDEPGIAEAREHKERMSRLR